MADKVEIIYAHHYGEHVPEDRDEVAEDLARRLVRAGIAVYATKAAAVDAEGEAGAERTATAVRRRGRAAAE